MWTRHTLSTGRNMVVTAPEIASDGYSTGSVHGGASIFLVFGIRGVNVVVLMCNSIRRL